MVKELVGSFLGLSSMAALRSSLTLARLSCSSDRLGAAFLVVFFAFGFAAAFFLLVVFLVLDWVFGFGFVEAVLLVRVLALALAGVAFLVAVA